MMRRVGVLVLGALVVGALVGSSFGLAATEHSEKIVATNQLLALAAGQFPNLTGAERALLMFVDLKNRAQGDFAAGGPSAVIADPTNDAARADGWDHEREVRAALIRWLCVELEASQLIDPGGIRLLGARITGALNLSRVRVPFPIIMRNCAIRERITLAATNIPALDLGGSHIGEMDAPGIEVDSDLRLDAGFNAGGEVNVAEARIGGSLTNSGHFRSSAIDHDLFDPKNAQRRAYYGLQMRIGGGLIFRDVHMDGGVELSGTTIGADLILDGSFDDPGMTVIDASSIDVVGNVDIGYGVPFEANGLVSFVTARIGTDLFVARATFSGAANEPHGLDASGISVKSALVWTNVSLPNGGFLNLSGASAGALMDDEGSWPAAGKLMLGGFTYKEIAQPDPSMAPGDAATRLRWLQLQPVFHPQPYRQLAKVLSESGDQAGATQVLIASEDANNRRFGPLGRMWGAFLNTTIGYGYEPLRAIVWSFAVVMLGSIVVASGKRAGVMSFKWPDRTPPPTGDPTLGLHPMLYSLDVFLPFVNLHQEQHWWPDETAAGECAVFGVSVPIRGSVLRYYLWLQIIAGWLLSAIFIAGVTGLVRTG